MSFPTAAAGRWPLARGWMVGWRATGFGRWGVSTLYKPRIVTMNRSEVNPASRCARSRRDAGSTLRLMGSRHGSQSARWDHEPAVQNFVAYATKFCKGGRCRFMERKHLQDFDVSWGHEPHSRRPQSALTSSRENWRGLTSAATRFMGSLNGSRTAHCGHEPAQGRAVRPGCPSPLPMAGETPALPSGSWKAIQHGPREAAAGMAQQFQVRASLGQIRPPALREPHQVWESGGELNRFLDAGRGEIHQQDQPIHGTALIEEVLPLATLFQGPLPARQLH